MKKIVYVLLALCLCVPLFCACGPDGGDNGGNNNNPNPPAGDPLASTLGFDRVINDDWPEFKILVNNSNNAFEMKTDFIGDDDGDKVSQKTAQRADSCEEYLSVELSYVERAGNYASKLPATIKDLINADNCDYALISMALNAGIQSQIISIYKNVLEMDVIDLGHMWWIDEMENQAAVNGQLYFLAGDACISTYGYLGCVYANLDTAERLSIFDSSNETFFYDLVKNGEWTLEQFLNIAETAKGGLSASDELAWINAETGVRVMFSSCDLSLVKTDPIKGALVNESLGDKAISFIEKMDGAMRDGVTQYFNASGLANNGVPMFTQNKALFLTHFVYEAVKFRDAEMESAYAVLPLPKYDANQKDYISTAISAFDALWFPSNLTPERTVLAAKVAEFMGYYGMEYIVPEYYDTTLKYKVNNEKTNATLDANVDMLDLIREKLRITPNETFGLIPGASDVAGTSMITITALSDANRTGTYPFYTQPTSTWKSFYQIGSENLNKYIMQYYGINVQ